MSMPSKMRGRGSNLILRMDLIHPTILKNPMGHSFIKSNQIMKKYK
jgi:hypothetical protein